jgi:hypothetical protein
MINSLVAVFIYSVWFSDGSADPDGRDRERVAYIEIEASRPDEAQTWGDVIAANYCHRHRGRSIVRSRIASINAEAGTPLATLLRIKVGDRPSDAALGW